MLIAGKGLKLDGGVISMINERVFWNYTLRYPSGYNHGAVEIEEKGQGLLLNFILKDRNEIYAIVKTDSGAFEEVPLGRLKVLNDKK